MNPTFAKPKKTDMINGVIVTLAVKYDVDWYPPFHNKRSIKRVLEWMQSYKMRKQDLVILKLAYGLTYKK